MGYLKDKRVAPSPILWSKLAAEARNKPETQIENGHQWMPCPSNDAHGRIDTTRCSKANVPNRGRLLVSPGACRVLNKDAHQHH